jgi:hypothetical protein
MARRPAERETHLYTPRSSNERMRTVGREQFDAYEIGPLHEGGQLVEARCRTTRRIPPSEQATFCDVQ